MIPDDPVSPHYYDGSSRCTRCIERATGTRQSPGVEPLACSTRCRKESATVPRQWVLPSTERSSDSLRVNRDGR